MLTWQCVDNDERSQASEDSEERETHCERLGVRIGRLKA